MAFAFSKTGITQPSKPPNKDKEIDMLSNSRKLIAVVGATGQQGGAVVRALQAAGQFKVRALSRNPGKHRELADEVLEADLSRPETLGAAFEGAHGVFSRHQFSGTWSR
jgi:uncharacterized protein YbjT (DUF2867 family)